MTAEKRLRWKGDYLIMDGDCIIGVLEKVSDGTWWGYGCFEEWCDVELAKGVPRHVARVQVNTWAARKLNRESAEAACA